MAQGQDGKPEYEKALGRYDEAAKAYATALERGGDAFPPLKEWLARARAKANGAK